MVGHVDHLADVRNGVPEDALDSLAERDCRHPAPLAAAHQAKVDVGSFYADQLRRSPMTGNGRVDVGGQHLSHLLGKGTAQLTDRFAPDRRTRAVGVVHRQALGGEVQRGSPKFVDVVSGNRYHQITMPIEVIGRRAVRLRYEAQLIGKLVAANPRHLNQQRIGFVAGLLLADLNDLVAGRLRNGQDVFFAHAASVERHGTRDDRVTGGATPSRSMLDAGFGRSCVSAALDHHGQMARALLILPTGTYRATEFIEAAAALDAEVIVASEENMALADQMGDDFLLIDCSRPEESARRIVELGDRQALDAIVPVDDQGVMIAALAAEQLGLRHNPPAAVALTRNKVMLRRALATAEISQPAFELAGPPDDVAALADVIGYPVVLKPLSMSASRGVIRADDAEAVRAAAERIRRILIVAGHNPNEPILIEQYVPGVELAVEGVLRRGELDVLAFFDKPDPLEGPFFEETLFITPSRLHPEMLDEVERVTARALSAMGLREGPIHAELRVDGSRVTFLEAAARSIGGLCGRSLRFGLLGTPLEVVLLRHALGRPLRRTRREESASGVMMLPIPRPGMLRRVDGIERALEIPGVTEIEITIPAGRRVRPLPEADRYLGFIFASGPTPEEVEQALRRAFASLEIVIDTHPEDG